MESKRNMLEQHDLPVPVKLAVGGTGIWVGMLDQIVHWAQVISILGGAVIVIFTLAGMVFKAFRRFKG